MEYNEISCIWKAVFTVFLWILISERCNVKVKIVAQWSHLVPILLSLLFGSLAQQFCMLVHWKPRVNHLTHLSHSVSPHGQKDSFFTHFWVILSMYWPTMVQMSQMIHSGFSVICVSFTLVHSNKVDKESCSRTQHSLAEMRFEPSTSQLWIHFICYLSLMHE